MNEYEYIILHIDGGMGKNVAATAVAHAIKKQHFVSKLIIVTAWPEVWIHNPDVHRVYKFGTLLYFYEDYIKDKKTKIMRLEPYHSEDLLLKRKHLAEVWCDLYDIPCDSVQPRIYLSNRELMAANALVKKQGPILVVQSSGGADGQGYPYSWARDLPPQVAQETVNLVKSQFSKVYQIRRDNQIVIDGTEQLTGNLRDIISVIALSDKFLGIDSLMQHACAALNKPATVGWIANSPTVFGYKLHNNIIAKGSTEFKHYVESYLEEYDWVGSRFHECPYTDVNSIFDIKELANSLLEPGTKLVDNNGLLLN